MNFTALRLDRRKRILEITLARPELLNRFDAVLHEEFTRALEELRADQEVRAAVLASTGRVSRREATSSSCVLHTPTATRGGRSCKMRAGC